MFIQFVADHFSYPSFDISILEHVQFVFIQPFIHVVEKQNFPLTISNYMYHLWTEYVLSGYDKTIQRYANFLRQIDRHSVLTIQYVVHSGQMLYFVTPEWCFDASKPFDMPLSVTVNRKKTIYCVTFKLIMLLRQNKKNCD